MPTTVAATVLDPELFVPELRHRRRDSVLGDLVGRAHRAGIVRAPEILTELLAVRERLGSTATGKSVALPNARSVTVIEPRMIVARSKRGIDWNADDGQPVHLVLMVLTPPDTTVESHHALLARAAAAVRLQRPRQKLIEADSFEAIAHLLKDVTP